MNKSTVEQIRERFDKDVERFSNLETGQVATMDAPLCLDLITRAASVTTPHAHELLDIGCGAGNYTLKMLQCVPNMNCTLIDLSRPMLNRAIERVSSEATGHVNAMQGDIRELLLEQESFDIIIASAALHHLRTEEEWLSVFTKIFHALRPGGSFWIFDLIEQATQPLQEMMQARYKEYLVELKGGGKEGEAYAKSVFDYIAEEDSPRSLFFQVQLMQQIGFENIDVLHKNAIFAAFGAQKVGDSVN